MDKDYLQNIANSPHVDEGLGDRILSRGTSGAQRLAAMTGGDFNDLNYTKIKSLFEGLVKKLSKTLEEFADGPHSIANRLEQMRPQITPQHQQAIQELRDLYDLLVPPYLRVHQVKNSVLEPRSSRSNLTELLSEGIFTRDMSLSSALQSNDATKILNAYFTLIKNQFSAFVRDAMKVTGTPKDYVKRVVGNLNQKWPTIWQKLDQISGTPPVLTVQQQQQQATGAAQPQPSVATATKPKPATSAQQGNKDDFALVVDRVIDIIIQAVKSDTERSDSFFSKELPKDFEAPAITKEDIDDPAEDGDEEFHKKKGKTPVDPAEEPVDAEPDPEEEDPNTSEFLYNFHAKYDKYPGKFAIDVEPTDKNLEIVQLKGTGKTKMLNVIWSSKQKENEIYVKHIDVEIEQDAEGSHYKTTGNPEHVMLFKFYDHQVNPRHPLSKSFSLVNMLKQANPSGAELFEAADKSIKATIASKDDAFRRALYATTSRKFMEFKRKLVSLTFDENGEVFKKTRSGLVPVPKDKLMAYLNSKDPKERERWKNSLEKIKYFEKFPNLLPKQEVTMDAIPNAMSAYKALQQLGVKNAPAMQAVQKAVEALGNTATEEAYIKKALENDLHKPKGSEEKPKPVSKEPVAPVSSEPSNPVSAPVSAPVSSEPTAPVSGPASAPISTPHPEPEKAPSKPGEAELGNATWDHTGTITWHKPSGKAVKLSPKQLKKMSIPRLELLLKKQGYFDKFPDAAKNKLEEGLINPFDLANFL